MLRRNGNLGTAFLGLSLFLYTGVGWAGEPASAKESLGDMFPYVMPWDRPGEGLTDLSAWNACPAGKYGPIREGSDGHWYSGKERIRFFGMNITSSAAFPSQADAGKIARRLAGFGVNLIRFHHLDASWAENIFPQPSLNTQGLNPGPLDRLDYFFKQLKDRGVYADINLLCSRRFLPGDGLPESIAGLAWKSQHAVGMFYRPLINLQKKYAAALFNHRNPYTRTTYAQDPAVAMVEINNENGLLQAWYLGVLDDLPAPFSGDLQDRWNRFLKKRYADDHAWRSAWTVDAPPGPELLKNGEKPAGSDGWTLEAHEQARVDLKDTPGPGKTWVRALRIVKPGTRYWHVQLNQKDLHITANEPYTLRFWGKAEHATTVTAYIMQAHAPWKNLGFEQKIVLGPQWQAFEFTCAFTAADSQARFGFQDLNVSGNEYAFALCSLRSGGTLAPSLSQSLEQGTAAVLPWVGRSGYSRKAQSDWVDFLWSLENDYWTEMRRYLKEDLKIQARLVGTQLGTSTPYLMNGFDAQDSHAYWQHPEFTGAPWESPWFLKNASLTEAQDGGPLAECAVKRVWGKPFTVTEYNHASPNSFDSEAFILLAAYAAFQDWDAVVGFNYAESGTVWGEDNVCSFFDIARHPGKMTSLIAAACMFRRGDVQTGRQPMLAELDLAQEKELLLTTRAWSLVDGESRGLTRADSLVHPVGMLLQQAPRPASAVPLGEAAPQDGRYVSDTRELTWDTKKRTCEINSPRTCGVIGFIEHARYGWHGVEMSLTRGHQGWGAVVLNQMDTPASGPVQHWLLSTLGMISNTGTFTRTYPDNQPGFPPKTDAMISGFEKADWGTAPTRAEGLCGEMVFPGPASLVRVFALDAAGRRKAQVPVEDRSGKAFFEFSQVYQTLWYEIEVQGPETRAVRATAP